MKKQTIFFIFFLLVLPIFVVAQPSPQSNPEFGLQIRTGSVQFLKQNEDFQGHIHVFNLSTGLPVTSGLDCFLHLYGVDGKQILTLQENETEGMFDYEFIVAGTNLTNLGVHNFIVQCNTSIEGGFRSDSVTITTTGLANSRNNPLWLILFFTVLNIGIFIMAFRVEFTESELSNFVVKRCVILLGLFVLSLNMTMVFSLNFTQGFNNIQGLMTTFLWIILFSIYLFMLVLFITMFVVAKKIALNEKIKKRMGNDGNR